MTLDSEGHVKEIDVFNIGQPILPSIGNLIYLTKFKVYILNVNTLPDEFGLLTNLEHLEFMGYYNSAEGINSAVPAPIYNLKKLKVLNIQNHPITEVDSGIALLADLEELTLRGCNLQSIDFGAISQLAKLRKLDIYGNYHLKDTVPSELFSLPELEHLILSYCGGLKGTLPSRIWTNSRIKSLELEGLRNMNITLPSEIKAMKNLETLYICETNLNGSLPQDIGECSKLKTISTDFTNVYGEIPQSITKLSDLESFSAIECSLSGHIPVGFKNCPKLRTMQLSGNRLTGGITADLAGIEILWLFDNNLSGAIPRDFMNNSSFRRNNWGKIYIDNDFEPIELGFDGPDLTDYYDTTYHRPFRYVEEYPNHELTVIFQFTPDCAYYKDAYNLLKDAYSKYSPKGLYITGRTFAEHAAAVKNANYPWPTFGRNNSTTRHMSLQQSL